jgi:hypothetical protein
MRSLLVALLGYVLAFLLMGTSPVGTGQGVHQNQLLDALVPHVHLDAGQVVPPSASPPPSEAYGHGPALGAGAGAAASALGLGLIPALPTRVVALTTASERWLVSIEDDVRPPEQSEAPPDPPPNFTRPAHS